VGRLEESEQTPLCLEALADQSVCVDVVEFVELVVFLAFERSLLSEQDEEELAVVNS